jgi:hypothetical protein
MRLIGAFAYQFLAANNDITLIINRMATWCIEPPKFYFLAIAPGAPPLFVSFSSVAISNLLLA